MMPDERRLDEKDVAPKSDFPAKAPPAAGVLPSTGSARLEKRDLALIGGLALFKILIHLPVLTRYGYHHDELYFIACGQHLSFGYVDHAPLVPWIARLATTLFGPSLFGLRIFSVLAGAAAVFLAGLIARRMGGGRFAQAMACLAMIFAPVYLRAGNMLCLPAFEVLFWTLTFYFLLRIIQEDNPRLWPWVGVALGIGLLNKHSMLFLGFGLAVGLALTPLRKYYRSLRLYAAAGIALVFFLPNLVWQAAHGWPTLGFVVNLHAGVMSRISPFQFLFGQILYIGILSAVLWIWGLVYVFGKKGRAFRLFGWIWLTVFVMLLLSGSKIYYLAPAYPPLLAAGSVALEAWIRDKGRPRLKPAAMALLFASGLALSPVSLPYLSIDRTEKYVQTVTLGALKNIYELTGDLRGMFGWRQRVDAVAEVYRSLPPEQQKRTIIFASDYGSAGVVDLFGPSLGLPHAYSLNLSYWLWGPPKEPYDTVIGVGFGPETMAKLFNRVDVAAKVDLKNVNSWETPFYVTIGRDPKFSLAAIWPKNRPW
jgi:4-amino-4-deoxy-L-arabinose transferase-like glycosyltransferase